MNLEVPSSGWVSGCECVCGGGGGGYEGGNEGGMQRRVKRVLAVLKTASRPLPACCGLPLCGY